MYKHILMFFAILILAPNAVADENNKHESSVLQVPDLATAYQKEFVFLRNQLQSLSQRKSRQMETQQSHQEAVEKEISELRQTLLALERQREALDRELASLDQAKSQTRDYTESMHSTVIQATDTLRSWSIATELKDHDSIALQVESIMQSAMKGLEKLSERRRESGRFFLADGRQTEGEIFWIGQLAAFGRSTEHHGALIPVSDGRWQIWQSNDGYTLPDLKGQSGPVFEAVIFQKGSLDKTSRQPKTILSTLQAGGGIAYVITSLGFLAAILIGFKLLALRKAQHHHNALETKVDEYINTRDLPGLSKLCSSVGGGSANLVALLLSNFGKPKEQLETLLAEAYIEQSLRLDRFSTFILVVAAIAPLLGLLGTVTGMIATFDVITEYGSGDPKMLSGGISEALVTTMLGLLVAIPVLLVGNMLNSWSETLKSAMEKLILHLSNRLSEEH